MEYLTGRPGLAASQSAAAGGALHMPSLQAAARRNGHAPRVAALPDPRLPGVHWPG